MTLKHKLERIFLGQRKTFFRYVERNKELDKIAEEFIEMTNNHDGTVTFWYTLTGLKIWDIPIEDVDEYSKSCAFHYMCDELLPEV